MRLHPLRVSLAGALCALPVTVSAQAGSGGFRAGELYLYSAAVDALSGGGGVVHIDPGTGVTDLMFDLATSVGVQGALCYDPFRDRLLFYGGFQPNHSELYASDAAGNLESLGFPAGAGPNIRNMAPRGDGLVYCISHTNDGVVSYLDAGDQVQTLMNAAGTGPYAFSGGVSGIFAMHCDAPTDQLVIASYSNLSECPSEVVDSVNVFVLQLSADGSRVVGESCLTHEVSPGPGIQLETPVAVTQGPGEDLLLTVHTTGGEDGRLVRIDLAGLSSSVFASNSYTGAPVIRGGTYSHVLGKAVILDPFNDVLRAYGEGEVGPGTIVASSGLSVPGISSETATLIEVAPATPLDGLSAAPATVSVSAGGSQTLSIDLGPPQAGATYVVVGSASGWTPGLFAGDTLIPVNLDGYLVHTLTHPNAIPLPDSVGALDGAGRATATFVLPPGSNPGLAGLLLHHAVLALDGGLAVTQSTNPVPVALVP